MNEHITTAFLFAYRNSNMKSDMALDRLVPVQIGEASDSLEEAIVVIKAKNEDCYVSWNGIEGWMKKGETMSIVRDGVNSAIEYLGKKSEDASKGDTFFGPFTIINHVLYDVRVDSGLIEVPAQVRYIARQAFRKAYQDSSVDINDGCVFIDRGAFEFSRVATVKVSSTVKHIGINCFNQSSVKQILYVGSSEEWTKLDKGLAHKKGTSILVYGTRKRN